MTLSFHRWLTRLAALLAAEFFLILASPSAIARQTGDEYSVINLGPEAGPALLNQHGQAAFSSYLPEAIAHGFFDGRNVHRIGTLGGDHTALGGLNNEGVVVGESVDATRPFGLIRAFAWTAPGGMRALPERQGWGASAYAVNDRRQVAGAAYVPGVGPWATRWNADGNAIRLGPMPQTFSSAYAINIHGVSTGFTEMADGQPRAMVWDETGRQRDLGTLGGPDSFGVHINSSGQVAGVSRREGRVEGFSWTPNGGMVAIGADGAGLNLVAGLNERGEIAGNTSNATLPYLWSARRGLRLLPLGGTTEGIVYGLNNTSVVVGAVTRSPGNWRQLRAVRWDGVAAPIDLSTRLYRPPAGLELYVGAAINDSGAILAHSNAGLVLLRPGRRGTAAPVLGPIVGAAADGTVGLHAPVDFTVGFVDNSPTESHVASASIDDGCARNAAGVREARGIGEVNLRHTFCRPGFYTIKVAVRDKAGHATEVQREVWATEPGLRTLTGSGMLPAGASGSGPPPRAALRFVLWAPLAPASARLPANGATPGSFSLDGLLHFRGKIDRAPEQAGALVRLHGTGSLAGRAGYRFQIETSNPAGGPDPQPIRVRISHRDPVQGTEVLDYDSHEPAAVTAANMVRANQHLIRQAEIRMR